MHLRTAAAFGLISLILPIAPVEAADTGAHLVAVGHRAAGVPRDSSGRIKRDPAQRSAFKRSHPCPANGRSSGSCPGYVIDHVVPLKRGGADSPSNMQWQSREAAKAKDRIE